MWRSWLEIISALIGPAPGGHFASVFQNCIQRCNLRFPWASRFSFFPSSLSTMDVPEPEQSPFTAVATHTSKITRVSLLRGSAILRPGCQMVPQDAFLTFRCSNTKPGSMPRLLMLLTAGLEPACCLSFSSCALSSRKGGTSVRLSSMPGGQLAGQHCLSALVIRGEETTAEIEPKATIRQERSNANPISI